MTTTYTISHRYSFGEQSAIVTMDRFEIGEPLIHVEVEDYDNNRASFAGSPDEIRAFFVWALEQSNIL